jgi:hypothetical protein
LKLRQALAQTNSLQDKKLLSELKGVVECDLPNNKLYKFDATLALGDKTYSLSNKQVLLRVSTARTSNLITRSDCCTRLGLHITQHQVDLRCRGVRGQREQVDEEREQTTLEAQFGRRAHEHRSDHLVQHHA